MQHNVAKKIRKNIFSTSQQRETAKYANKFN